MYVYSHSHSSTTYYLLVPGTTTTNHTSHYKHTTSLPTSFCPSCHCHHTPHFYMHPPTATTSSTTRITMLHTSSIIRVAMPVTGIHTGNVVRCRTIFVDGRRGGGGRYHDVIFPVLPVCIRVLGKTLVLGNVPQALLDTHPQYDPDAQRKKQITTTQHHQYGTNQSSHPFRFAFHHCCHSVLGRFDFSRSFFYFFHFFSLFQDFVVSCN